MEPSLLKNIETAAGILRNAKYAVAFTGSGISVESGIPSFRGSDGIWSRYDPKTLELGYFYENPLDSWRVIKEIFYSYFDDARANRAHEVLAEMEGCGMLKSVITQNIDNLHQQAGSKTVYEFHGNSQKLVCTSCRQIYPVAEIDLSSLPPCCRRCDGLLKPDFIFFGEGIPADAYHNSLRDAEKADVMLVIGTTGEVMPAAQMPYIAKQNGALILEVNTERSKLTAAITDIFLQGKASGVMDILGGKLFSK
ncbi:MAG: NAD-dependent deacylase [Bacteroidales bacterium]|nr:NAD-dependent deacylase [Bacteroidales bacterium]